MSPKALLEQLAEADRKQANRKAETAEKQQAARGTRNPEQAALRGITSHFGEAGALALRHHVVEGKTLLQTVVADMQAAKAEKRRLSSAYWVGLRQKFGHNDGDPQTDGDDIDARLIEAIRMATTANTTKRSTAWLVEWLTHAEALNAREKRGLCNYLLGLRPLAIPRQRAVLLAFMRLMVRINVTFGDEQLQGLRAQCDAAVSSHWAALNAEGIDRAAFVRTHRDEVSLVLDMQLFDRVVAFDGALADVATELSVLSTGGWLGRELFQATAKYVVGEQLTNFIVERLAGLPDHELSTAAWRELKEQCHDEARRLQADKVLHGRRDIAMQYRGLDITLTVDSWVQETSLRMACKAKELASGGAQLRFFVDEQGIFEVGGTKCLKLGENIAEDWDKARETWNSIVEAQALKGAARVKKLSDKMGILASIDRSFMVEEAVRAALLGADGAKLVRERIMASMPSKERHVSLEAAAQRLAALSESSLLKSVGDAAASSVEAVRDTLAGMERGTAPNMVQLTSTDWGSQVCERLEYFLVREVGEPGKIRTVVFGRVAVPRVFDECNRLAKENKLSFGDLQPLRTYAWLLSGEQKEEVEALTRELLKKVSGAKRATEAEAAPQQRGKRCKGKAANAAAPTEASETADVMALFA